MVYEGFLYALKEEGIEESRSIKSTIDPNKHHAVQAIPAEEGQEKWCCCSSISKGYNVERSCLKTSDGYRLSISQLKNIKL